MIVRDLAAGPRRFVELQRVLPGISTEQLRSRLNRMVADGMLTRKRYREVPPRVDYELTDRAQELMPVLGALARWGYEWAWTAPRSSESIDLGAIFRLAPGLVHAGGLDGTVQFTVLDGRHGGGPATYSFTLTGDRVTITERDVDGCDATVKGDTAAWVSAFSPERDRSALAINGELRLAETLLDGLALGSSHASSSASAGDAANAA